MQRNLSPGQCEMCNVSARAVEAVWNTLVFLMDTRVVADLILSLHQIGLKVS
jgi:hypothetical protein